jgi:hypothetical protein
LESPKAGSRQTQGEKTIRLNAAQEALLSAIASGATDDAVLDEFLAAANHYRKEDERSKSWDNCR